LAPEPKGFEKRPMVSELTLVEPTPQITFCALRFNANSKGTNKANELKNLSIINNFNDLLGIYQ
jgi:hypothetical protein